jgi:hypothetical protein
MLNVEIRLVMHEKEVSVESFVEAMVREIRTSVREEIWVHASGFHVEVKRVV